MKILYSGAFAGALLVGAAPLLAQTSPAAPAVSLAPVAPTTSLPVSSHDTKEPGTLRAGTPVTLKMTETITTKAKKLEAGYIAHLEVMDAVTVDNIVVIPAGSAAAAEITDVRNKGMWGKSGRINARLLYVTVGDRKIKLRGIIDDKGVTGTAGVVAAIAFVPIAGFFTTGTSATLPMGAAVKGFVDEDISLIVAKAPAVEAVPVPVPVAASVLPSLK
jgi:phage tail sheath gpL-like